MLLHKSIIKNGMPIESFSYYENGKLKSKTKYDSNQMWGEARENTIYYDKNGNIIRK